MTAPASGSAHSVCDDAMRRAEQILGDVLERGVFFDSLPEIRSAIREEVNALKSARALADARAKQAAPDVGGTTLDLNASRIARAALKFAATFADANGPFVCDGITVDASALREVRKQINQGVASNAARRCG